MDNFSFRKLFQRLGLSIFLFFLVIVQFQENAQAQVLDDLQLKPIGTYETGIFDDGGSEIPAYDAATQRLFVTNGANGVIDVLDISDPTNPTKLFDLSVVDEVPEGGITSIAVGGGLVGVTVEIEGETGKVVFFPTDAADGEVAATAVVDVGYLPDMLIFTPDETKVLVANEGEPLDDGTDFQGSISIITVEGFTVEEASFEPFDGREDELRARGVRIFTTDTVSYDLEPEGIAISPDGTTAFAALQENNAIAVVDIATSTVLEILPMGYKDHSKPQPILETFELEEEPLDGDILFGGLSGLFFKGMTEDGNYEFVTVPDRGPNGNPTSITGKINSFTFANIETAGDAFAVNVSQVVEIVQGTTYTLTFDASSDRDRTMIAGIGLNEAPFTAATQTVNLTTGTRTYTLTLTATDFGIANSRVLFDMGAEVGTVVIDNVSLVEDTSGEEAIDTFCNTPVRHFGGDVGSEVFVSIFNVDEQTMRIEVAPVNSDPIDALVLPAGDWSVVPGISVEPNDNDGDGIWEAEFFFPDGAPATLDLYFLWSKESFEGNWSSHDFGGAAETATVDFNATCDADGGSGEPFDDGLLTNGDFEDGTNGWIGNALDVRQDGGGTVTGRPFLLPDFQAKIYTLTLDPETEEVTVTNTIPLKRLGENDEEIPITGLPNIPGVDEFPVIEVGVGEGDFTDENDKEYVALRYDPYGGDMEGIVINPGDGTYWMVDEYRPAIYHFLPDGTLFKRYVPEGTAALAEEAEGFFGEETLPEVYNNRRANRGFEGMALDTDNGILYAFIQTPLSNPDRDAGDASSIIRMLGIDPADGTPVAEYVYLLEKPGIGGNVDKIGDAVYNPETGTFYVMERDSGLDPTSKKFIFEVDLKGATDILGLDIPTLTGITLEEHTPDAMIAAGINPVYKTKVLNLPSLGYLPSDKPEGLALLPGGNLAVINDNDFGLEEGAEAIELGIIVFDGINNAIDASDRDGAINIVNQRILGMFQPDGIAAVELEGNTFYVTANEGDAREYDFFEEEDRVKDLTLDEEVFPNAASMQEDFKLGRLTVSNVDGDIDGDGDFDRIFSYGARSFSIWDATGNLIFDSGDEFEQITAEFFPDDFNSTNDENGSFESRSDNKGPEPEGVAIGEFNGRTYAFIGLERIGGIMVYDISDPYNAEYEGYFNNRDFEGDAEAGTAGDLAPEGLVYVPAEDSPNGEPLLIVANEVSGSTTIFGASTAFDEEFSAVQPISVEFSGRYETGLDDGNAEIVAVDTVSDIMFVLNSSEVSVDRVNIKDVNNPIFIDKIDISARGPGIQSVAVNNIGLVAVAVQADEKTDNGLILFMDTTGGNIGTVEVGPLPDMIAFTPDGNTLVVANEGEPNDDYTIDPEGSVSFIDVSNAINGSLPSAVTVSFAAFNDQKADLIASGIRIFGPETTVDEPDDIATVAQDLEPEYIAFSGDGSIAYVICQENNAIALFNVENRGLEALLPLGFKDHYLEGNGLDASNRDGGINIEEWPVYGMYQPDAIATYEIGGKTYIFSANEGDSRDYLTEVGDDEIIHFSEEARVKDLDLDPDAFPYADELQMDEYLGRLKTTTTLGDTDGDGDYDEIYSYGARSFSVWDGETGALIYDSGDDFEQLSAVLAPEIFNSNRGGDSPDNRSDDKGPEPEAVTVGEVNGRIYAFIGLERQGGFMVYDVTNPMNPAFVTYEFSTVPTDDSPEGIVFIPAEVSTTGNAQLVLSYEESSTVAIFEINPEMTAEAPADPTDLVTESISNSEIFLSWSAGGDDTEIGYRIERAELAEELEFTEIASLNSADSAIIDNTVMANTAYVYRVKAFKGGAESGYSNNDTTEIGFYMHLVHNNDGESQLINAGSDELAIFGGVARYKTVVDELRAYAEETSNGIVVVSSGDNFIPSPEFDASLSRAEGEPYYDAVVINEVGYDALAIGNHDFDFGPDVLEKLIMDTEEKAPAFLSANLDFSAEAGLQALVDAERIAPAVVVEKQGEEIGIIGLTTPNLPFISTPRQVEVSDMLTEIVQAQVDSLEGIGVNKIVLISHLQGLDEELDLAATVSGIDLIVAGGGDNLLANDGDALLPGDEIEGPYPTITQDVDGEDVFVVTTSGEFRYVGHLLVEFDDMGKVKQVSDLSGPILVSPDIEEDGFLVSEVVEPVIAHLEGLAANVIATSEVNLDGVRNNVRSQETNLGNLIADAMLWQANQVAGTTGFDNVPQATVGIQNGGGIRNNNVIAPGDFTELNTFDILPFGNFVTVVENIGPAQFKELVENAVSRSEDVENNSGTGRFAQIAGFSVIYDSTLTAITFDDDANTTTEGERVIAITLEDGTEIVKSGELVDGAPSVNVAIADFSARGGDQYPFRGATFTPLGVSYQQALLNYITASTADGGLEGTIAAAAYPEGGEGRITVEVCDVTQPTISVSSGTDGEGAEFVLTSSATEGNQWFLDGTAISGATGQTLNVTESGSYTVQVTIGSCISEFSEAFAVTALDGDIALLANSLVIYPNPTNDLLNMQWDSNLNLKPEVLEVFSTDGRKLFDRELGVNSNAIQLKMKQFTNGLYIIKLKVEGFVLQKKIIKQ